MTKKNFTLNAETRKETGKSVDALRQIGNIPAVLYGHKVKNQNLKLKLSDFEKVLNEAGESTLVDLKVDNSEPVKVLIHAISREAVSHKVIHVDFYQVNMKEKVKTDVELVFINESPAVKNLSAVLVKALDKIEIECLPSDLISHLDIDLSTLKEFGDVIRIKDLNLSENISILNDLESPIVLAEEPKKVEEEKPFEEGSEETAEGEECSEEKSNDEKSSDEKTDSQNEKPAE